MTLIASSLFCLHSHASNSFSCFFSSQLNKLIIIAHCLLSVELCPPKFIRLCTNHHTSECDLIWKHGHYRYNSVKWCLTGEEWAPNQTWLVSYKGEIWTCTHIMWRWKRGLSDASTNKGTPESASEHPKLGESMEPPHSPQKKPTLPTSWSWTSSLLARSRLLKHCFPC